MKNVSIITPREFEHAVKVAGVSGQTPDRDVALMFVAYGTGLMPIELAKISIADYLNPDGTVQTGSVVRAAIAFNNQERPLHWTNRRVQLALDAYLAERVRYGYCLGVEGKYRGLAPDSPIFLTVEGNPFTFTRRVTKAGTESYSCESLTQIVRRIHTQAGIASGSALSARKSFMVRLAQAGIDARHIQKLLGVQSLSSVRRVTDNVSVDLGSMISIAV